MQTRTHHPDGTCVFIFSVYGVLLFLSVFILFIFFYTTPLMALA